MCVGCGDQGTENLSSCVEVETGYHVVRRSSGLECLEARSILGLLGAAEHGKQTVEAQGGPWTCHVYPRGKGAIRYRCQQGANHFDVVQE